MLPFGHTHARSTAILAAARKRRLESLGASGLTFVRLVSFSAVLTFLFFLTHCSTRRLFHPCCPLEAVEALESDSTFCTLSITDIRLPRVHARRKQNLSPTHLVIKFVQRVPNNRLSFKILVAYSVGLSAQILDEYI